MTTTHPALLRARWELDECHIKSPLSPVISGIALVRLSNVARHAVARWRNSRQLGGALPGITPTGRV